MTGYVTRFSWVGGVQPMVELNDLGGFFQSNHSVILYVGKSYCVFFHISLSV